MTTWEGVRPATSRSRCEGGRNTDGITTRGSGGGTAGGDLGGLPLRRHVPVRLPDVAVDPRGPRPDRPHRQLALLQSRGGEPPGGEEAPVGTGVVLRVVDDAYRCTPATHRHGRPRPVVRDGGPGSARGARSRSRTGRPGDRRPDHRRRGVGRAPQGGRCRRLRRAHPLPAGRSVPVPVSYTHLTL